ncbi:hypothetical protein B5S31_g3434 [[Candida] boidinii]|nr:hypothetical protein B5S31_g3434 [[Candida] boidinii]
MSAAPSKSFRNDFDFGEDEDDYSKTSTNRPEPPKNRRFIKQPDNKARDAKLKVLNDKMAVLDKEINDIKKKIEITITPKDILEKRKVLTTELNELIRKQQDIKNKRNLINDQIKSIDISMKKKINEISSQISKNSFKNVDEIDNQIKKLDDLIGTGTLKIVDERRYIKEISSLRKLRKDFGSIESQQKSIDGDKEKISELKKKLTEFSNKEIQSRFEEIQKELDTLNNSNKSIQTKRDNLFNSRRALYKDRDDLYSQIKKIRADFDQEFKKFKESMEIEKKRRVEEERVYRLELKKADLLDEIEFLSGDLKKPAFAKEIDEIESLLVFFDPSYTKSSSSSSSINNSSFKTRTSTGRVIEAPADVVILKKEAETFFKGGKSTKKGKKSNNNSSSSSAKNFTMEPAIISRLSELSISLPVSQDDVPTTIESLNSKFEDYKVKQVDETKKNNDLTNSKIEKLQLKVKEIETEIATEQAKDEEKKKSVETETEKEEESTESESVAAAPAADEE